jgi:hypothetical protein
MPQSNCVITSRDVRIDKNVIYYLQHSKDPLQREQALCATLNNVNIDELDSDVLLIRNDTAELVEAQTGAQGHKAPPVSLGGDRTSLQGIPLQVML